MSKIAMTRAQRRKIDATVSDARRAAHDAADTVKEAADRARRLSREGRRRGRAAGQALAGRRERSHSSAWLFAVVGAIGAGLGAIATGVARRATLARRRAYAEDLAASVAKELGVDEVPAATPSTPPTSVNGAVPTPRGRVTDRTV